MENSQILRHQINNFLDNNMPTAAIHLAEHLCNYPGHTDDDYVLLAKSFYLNAQYLRCLNLLERRRLLDISSLAPFLDAKVHSKLPIFLLAGQCLLALDRFDECCAILSPFASQCEASDLTTIKQAILQYRKLFEGRVQDVNLMACIYCIIGRAYECLDNRERSRRSFIIAIKVDPACLEAVGRLTKNCSLTTTEKHALYSEIDFGPSREYLRSVYKEELLDQEPVIELGSDDCIESATVLTKRAEKLLENSRMPEEAYRLLRQAYLLDNADQRCLCAYIATLVQLGHRTELFYLGHELTKSGPKDAISWYAVGCYYWSCRKLDLAKKFLIKCTKLDSRFAKAFVALGVVLSAQDESEHAINAFRAATRLMPGDHRPLVMMAKELSKNNNPSHAIHLLSGALELAPSDPMVRNELGVVYMALDQVDYALVHLEIAADTVRQYGATVGSYGVCGEEVFSNYATALRRQGRLSEALEWYDLCLVDSPQDANTHAAIGLTLHLLQRFDDAISAYHKALALHPTSAFCATMLSRALEDSMYINPTAPAVSTPGGRV